MTVPVSLVIAGAGSRGTTYAGYALAHPEKARVVAVAEPRAAYREPLARSHGLDGAAVACDWRELADRPRFADAAIIATQDRDHLEPALAFLERGYHVLLEKPMASDEESCCRIVEGALAAGTIFAVCHVLRYTPLTRMVKALLRGGAIGEVVDVQRLEPVGYWHQAHSFVRGNWSREKDSSSMLLAKCCHDLDWIRHVVGVPCRQVQSFGSLFHFRPERAPEGAAARCLECPIEGRCAYSAPRHYLGRLERGECGWPLDVLTPDTSREGILRALREGPYGRCVYECDNDVVDHQVVSMEFEGGRTATLTMNAFNAADRRQTRIFGTAGELVLDGRRIRQFDFLSERWRELEPESERSPGRTIGGHGGGDDALMRSFVAAVGARDARLVLSGPEETLETHRMVFAAERSRREGRVIALAPFTGHGPAPIG